MKEFICLSLFILSGCKGLDSALGTSNGGGSTITTFSSPAGLQIDGISGQSTAVQVLVGKFNNDAYDDIVELTANGVYVFLSNGGSSWNAPALIASTAAGSYLTGAAVNLNKSSDSILDLILFKSGTGVQFFTNNGSGSFSLNSSLAKTDLVTSVAVATAGGSDLDGMLFYSRGSSGFHFSAPFLADDLLASSSNHTDSASQGVRALAASLDSGTDSISDFVLAPTSGSLLLYKNNDFSSVTYQASLSRSGAINDAAAVSLSSGARPSIFVAATDGIELYTSSADFLYTESTIVTPTSLPLVASRIILTDVTEDGLLDLFAARDSNDSVLYTNTGNTFVNVTSTAFNANDLLGSPIDITHGDFDGDRVEDLVELYSDGVISIHINSAEAN